MNIVITGGAGYLGSVLTARLLNYGHHVTVVDSFVHGVPSLAGLVQANHKLKILARDICLSDPEVARKIDRADAVIHLAALVGAPACDKYPEIAKVLNFQATRRLVEILRPEQRLIFPCTNSGYGRGGDTPCTERDPMKPLSLYGITKVQAEAEVAKHPRGVSLRFATLYGPSLRMRLDLLVNAFAYEAMRKRRLLVYEAAFRRCVLHVSDAAAAISHALFRDETLHDRGPVWNVGAENVTKAQICGLLQELVPGFVWMEGEGKDPDQRDYAVSSEAFKEATGWAPAVPLKEGIEQLLRLYAMPFGGPGWWNA